MWPKGFDYTRAASVDEAIKLAVQNPAAKILAGGHSLLPTLKLRLSEPSLLIDIGRIESLKGVSANGSLKIGALTTHAEVATSAQVQGYAPALALAAGQIGDPAVRNFATLGGNIAHADPASDPPTVLTAYDAMIHVQGVNGARIIGATDFFIDLFTTSLQPDELVTGIEIVNQGSMKSAYAKLPHPASRYAVVGVCVSLQVSGGMCQNARVAVGGATVHAMRSPSAEAALIGSSMDSKALEAAAQGIRMDVVDHLTGDMTFPMEYRHAMAGVYLKRAIRQALS